MTRTNELVRRDQDLLWHPATHFGDLERLPPIAVSRARGSYLFDADGRPILDAISSWWTSVHGHCHPEMVAALTRQVASLDHVMFAGFTHRPAVELAEALVERAPPGYGKVFFTDCGSAAVEVALKLSYQSRLQSGQPQRNRFATLVNSYHGETMGALAMCGSKFYREPFSPLLMDVVELPTPVFANHEHSDLATTLGADDPTADRAIAMLREHASTLTAIVIEPLIQCAGRMTMTGAGFYGRLVAEAQALGIHVIADEIAVGFGRTGKLLASEWPAVVPDLMCLSKGLSGGILPLACVLIRRGFEDVFTGAPSRSFMHSHTFTGNPLACAAALASLELFDRTQLLARLPARVKAIETRRRQVAAALGSLVAHHRQLGMIAALEVAPPPGKVPDGRLGLALRTAALERGVLLRPLHDTIYWMPPLTISDAELDQLAEVTEATVRAVLE